MLVKTDTENLMAAVSGGGLSDTFSDKVDNSGNEYKTADVLTKYNKASGLWDTTWDSDEDDDN